MEIKVLKGQEAIASYLGMSKQTFWRKRDELQIPYYRVGGMVYARSVALDEWISEREKEQQEAQVLHLRSEDEKHEVL